MVNGKCTYESCLSKLTALCARSEHCTYEMEEKMKKWEVDAETQQKVIAYLVKEKYVDDARYARFFINDKVKYNKWGRRKVEMALRMKRIDEAVYRPLLDEMDEGEDYTEILRALLRTKIKSVKGKSQYEIRMKLIRFALSRGFTMDVINGVLNDMSLPEASDQEYF